MHEPPQQQPIFKGRWNSRQLATGAIVAALALGAVIYLAYAAWPKRPPATAGAPVSATSSDVELRRTVEDLRREVAELRRQVDQLQEDGKGRSAAPSSPPRAADSGYQRPAEPPAQPVNGKLERVIDTGTIAVGGRNLQLWGLRPVSDAQHVASLQKFITDNGGSVTCDPRGEQFSCRTGNGYDLAAVVLSNGGGRASAEAPPDYKRYEQDAKKKKLGIWR